MVRIQNTLRPFKSPLDYARGLQSLILAFNVLCTLRDLIINDLDLQGETQIIRTFLVSLEEWSSPILEILAFSLPHACAGRHWSLLSNKSRLTQIGPSVHF
jgi:hypothetical protein